MPFDQLNARNMTIVPIPICSQIKGSSHDCSWEVPCFTSSCFDLNGFIFSNFLKLLSIHSPPMEQETQLLNSQCQADPHLGFMEFHFLLCFGGAKSSSEKSGSKLHLKIVIFEWLIYLVKAAINAYNAQRPEGFRHSELKSINLRSSAQAKSLVD